VSSGGTIYAAGSRQNQSLYVRAKGTGTVKVKQEDWKQIEPPGANFVNGWKNANAAFFKDGLGIVHFRGLVFKDGGVGAREDIFNLPDEYKCAIEARYIVPWSNSNNRGYGYLDISNGVKVTLGGNPPASHILVHLDGVTFPASSP